MHSFSTEVCRKQEDEFYKVGMDRVRSFVQVTVFEREIQKNYLSKRVKKIFFELVATSTLQFEMSMI